MSLGAAALTNDGALLLVDSMGINKSGSIIFQRPDARKALPFPSVEGVGFVSGSHDYTRLLPKIYDRTEMDLEALVTNLYDDLFYLQGQLVQRAPAVGSDGPPHLLVATATRLAIINPFEQRITASPTYAFAGGWVKDFIMPRGIAPEAPGSLAEAREVLVMYARECIAYANRLRGVVTVGWPLYLYTLTDQISTERIHN